MAAAFPEHHEPNSSVHFTPSPPNPLPLLPASATCITLFVFFGATFALTSHPLWELAAGLMRPAEAEASDCGALAAGAPPRRALGPRVFAGQK